MALSDKQVQDVCMQGMGDQECRYLDTTDYDPQTGRVKFMCKKQSLDKKIIDEEVDEHISESTNKGIDPRSAGLPMGDNCVGFLPMKALLQGYDV